MIILKRLFENKGKAKFTLVKEMGHNSKKYSGISYTKFRKLEDLLFYPAILTHLSSFHQERRNDLYLQPF